MEVYILIIIILFIIYFVTNNTNKKKKENTFEYRYKKAQNINTINYNSMPYIKKRIVSDNEFNFYKELKKAVDKEQLIIMCKVGLKDIATIKDKNNYMSWFGKIAQKHVDFLICSQNLNIIMAIELDDSSHKKYKAIKNDDFKNEFFETIKIPLIRIKAKYNYNEIHNMIFNEPKYPNITYNY